MARSACVSVDDAITTASISGSDSAVTVSVVPARYFFASACAAAALTSTTYFSRASSRAAMLAA